jgi:hypothetical protein
MTTDNISPATDAALDTDTVTLDTEAADVTPVADIQTETSSEPVLPALRILKIANCGSLSGRSTLTYHVGILEATSDNATQDIHRQRLLLQGLGLNGADRPAAE